MKIKNERAQTMVEFAIVFPVLLLITYGIMEFGRMVFIYAAVTGATREGARYGAAAGDVLVGGKKNPYYSDCNGIKQAAQRGAILTPINPSEITIWYDSGPNTTIISNTCPPKNSKGLDPIVIGDRVIVHAIAHYTPMIAFLGFNGFDIVSENARTILMNIEIKGTPPTPRPTYTPTTTHTPTTTPTATLTPTPKK